MKKEQQKLYKTAKEYCEANNLDPKYLVCTPDGRVFVGHLGGGELKEGGLALFNPIKNTPHPGLPERWAGCARTEATKITIALLNAMC